MKENSGPDKKSTKVLIFVVLGIFVGLVGVALLFPVVKKQMITHGRNIDQNIEERFEEEREVLKEEFDYLGDVAYLIRDKTKRSVYNPLSGDRTYFYYLIGEIDEVVYRLEVPLRVYNRSIIGDASLFKKGSDNSYMLSVDGENVVRRIEVKE